MISLTNEDKKWLSQEHDGLKFNEDATISGIIKFTASYEEQSGQFYATPKGRQETTPGIQLNGSFNIVIKERTNTSVSNLPALHVEDVDTIANRHFNQTDHSACLCSPLEEDEFLIPRFEFIPFIEQLVVPFLYGQVFYTKEKRWPWPEYEHGAVGILESYGKINDPQKIKDCIHKLAQDSVAWTKIKEALLKKGDIKGGLPCFCAVGDHRRRCHPNALVGIRQLKNDIEKNNTISYIEEVDKIIEENKKTNKVFWASGIHPLIPSALHPKRKKKFEIMNPNIYV